MLLRIPQRLLRTRQRPLVFCPAGEARAFGPALFCPARKRGPLVPPLVPSHALRAVPVMQPRRASTNEETMALRLFPKSEVPTLVLHPLRASTNEETIALLRPNLEHPHASKNAMMMGCARRGPHRSIAKYLPPLPLCVASASVLGTVTS